MFNWILWVSFLEVRAVKTQFITILWSLTLTQNCKVLRLTRKNESHLQRKSLPLVLRFCKLTFCKLPTWLCLGCICMATVNQLRASVIQQRSNRDARIYLPISNFCVNSCSVIATKTKFFTMNLCRTDQHALKVNLYFCIS